MERGRERDLQIENEVEVVKERELDSNEELWTDNRTE